MPIVFDHKEEFIEYIQNNTTDNCLYIKDCRVNFDFDIYDIDYIIKDLEIKNIKFRSAVFNQSFKAENINYTSLSFGVCEFMGEFTFSSGDSVHSYIFTMCEFQKDTLFEDCVFNNSFQIKECHFYNSVNFCNIIAKEDFLCTKCEFHNCEAVSFAEVTFEKSFLCRYTKFTSSYLIFEDCKFNSHISFRNSNLWKTDFSNCNFESTFGLKGISLYDNIKFDLCKFQGKFNARRLSCEKLTPFVISDCDFASKVNFQEAVLGNLQISHSRFINEINFNEAQISNGITAKDVDFNGKVYFYQAGFGMNPVSFWNCNFHDTVKFVDIGPINETLPEFYFNFSTIEKLFMIDIEPVRRYGPNSSECLYFRRNIVFEYCFISQSALLILRSIRAEGLIMDYANIIGNVILQDIQTNILNMENTTVTGNITMVDSVKFKKVGGRNTARILKHEAQKNSDKVNFLKYRKKEHIQIIKSHYKNPVIKYYQYVPKIFSKAWYYIKGVPEAIVAGLNFISNDFGRSWFMGVLFTLTVSWVFVAWLQFMANKIVFTPNIPIAWNYFWGTFWSDILKFLWLPDMLEGDMKDWEKSSWTLYVLGKILVGFGIYQTIAAFRRYGK